MKVSQILNEAQPGDDEAYLPDDAVPYKSRNETGTMPLSPFSNDWDPPAGFKDAGSLVMKLEGNEFRYSTIQNVPLNKVLATQYWIYQEGRGFGDPVVPELSDKADLPVAFLLPDGYFHLIDGHHRVDDAIRKRTPQLKMWVVKLP